MFRVFRAGDVRGGPAIEGVDLLEEGGVFGDDVSGGHFYDTIVGGNTNKSTYSMQGGFFGSITPMEVDVGEPHRGA